MDYFLLAVFVLTFLFSLRAAFWPGADDPSWEMHWRALDHLDQAWIAAASYEKGSRSKLEERGELGLSKGYNRREDRRRSFIELAVLPLLIGLTVLVVAGVLPDSLLGLPLALYGTLQATVYYLRKRRISSRYRTAQELETASML